MKALKFERTCIIAMDITIKILEKKQEQQSYPEQAVGLKEISASNQKKQID